MDQPSSEPTTWARRILMVTASLVIGAFGWFLLGEPETLGAKETTQPEQADLYARVEGIAVTRSDVRAELAEELDALELERRELIAKAVEARVEQILIDAEAARRGVDQDLLMEHEIEARLGQVSDADVAAAMAERGVVAPSEDLVIATRRELCRRAFLRELEQHGQVQIFRDSIAGTDGAAEPRATAPLPLDSDRG
ncbi:MAG: hypothetical protein AAGN66_15635 [Acidobacteriota bacterium]